MNYVDGFVIPVPKKNLAAYRSMAKVSAKVWRQHGALEFYEALATTFRSASGRHSRAA